MKNLHRYVVFFLFLAVFAGTWDVWWHGAIGRDTLWEPPHLVLYASIIIAITLGAYGWYKTKEKLWKRLAFVLLIIPLAAPFDELWHRAFGVENISSPLIIWSPPHLALIFALFASFYILLPLIKKEEKEARLIFGTIVFGGLLNLLLFLTGPIAPTGPWALIGFLGAGLMAFLFITLLLAAQRFMPYTASASMVAIFYLLLASVTFGEIISPDIIISPHDHAPNFLVISSFLFSAVFLDLKKGSLLLRGAVSAFIWAAILYGFSSYFFQPEFKYSLGEGSVAIVAAVIGGALATLFYRKKIT